MTPPKPDLLGLVFLAAGIAFILASGVFWWLAWMPVWHWPEASAG